MIRQSLLIKRVSDRPWNESIRTEDRLKEAPRLPLVRALRAAQSDMFLSSSTLHCQDLRKISVVFRSFDDMVRLKEMSIQSNVSNSSSYQLFGTFCGQGSFCSRPMGRAWRETLKRERSAMVVHNNASVDPLWSFAAQLAWAVLQGGVETDFCIEPLRDQTSKLKRRWPTINVADCLKKRRVDDDISSKHATASSADNHVDSKKIPPDTSQDFRNMSTSHSSKGDSSVATNRVTPVLELTDTSNKRVNHRHLESEVFEIKSKARSPKHHSEEISNNPSSKRQRKRAKMERKARRKEEKRKKKKSRKHDSDGILPSEKVSKQSDPLPTSFSSFEHGGIPQKSGSFPPNPAGGLDLEAFQKKKMAALTEVRESLSRRSQKEQEETTLSIVNKSESAIGHARSISSVVKGSTSLWRMVHADAKCLLNEATAKATHQAFRPAYTASDINSIIPPISNTECSDLPRAQSTKQSCEKSPADGQVAKTIVGKDPFENEIQLPGEGTAPHLTAYSLSHQEQSAPSRILARSIASCHPNGEPHQLISLAKNRHGRSTASPTDSIGVGGEFVQSAQMSHKEKEALSLHTCHLGPRSKGHGRNDKSLVPCGQSKMTKLSLPPMGFQASTPKEASTSNAKAPQYSPENPGRIQECINILQFQRSLAAPDPASRFQSFPCGLAQSLAETRLKQAPYQPHRMESSIPPDDQFCRVTNRTAHIGVQYQDLPPVTVLCSEAFIDTWGDVVAELSSGRWSAIAVEHGDDLHTSSIFAEGVYSEGRKIELVDTSLIDKCQIDLELANRTAVLLYTLSALADEQDAKNAVIQLAQLAAKGRYKRIVVFLSYDVPLTHHISRHVVQLQSAALWNGGKMPSTTFIKTATPKSLSACIAATVFSSVRAAPLAEVELAHLEKIRNQEYLTKVSFLIGIAPALTVTGALHCLRIAETSAAHDGFSTLIRSQATRQTIIAASSSNPPRTPEIHPDAMQHLVRVLKARITSQQAY